MSSQVGLEPSKVYIYEGELNLPEILIHDVQHGWIVYKLKLNVSSYYIIAVHPYQTAGQLSTLAKHAPRAPIGEPYIDDFIREIKDLATVRGVVNMNIWQSRVDTIKEKYSTLPALSNSLPKHEKGASSVQAQSESKPQSTKGVLKKKRKPSETA